MQENCIIYDLKRERGQKIQGVNQRSVRVSKIRGGVFGKQNPRRGFRGAKSEEGIWEAKFEEGFFGKQYPRRAFWEANSEEGLSGSKNRAPKTVH